jgi:hypothetical protein
MQPKIFKAIYFDLQERKAKRRMAGELGGNLFNTKKIYFFTKITKRTIPSLLIILFPINSWSQVNRYVEIKGMGGQTCGQYASHRRSAPGLLQQLYSQWAQGVISGYNLGIPQSGLDDGAPKLSIRVPDEATINLFLDNYCRSQPLNNITQGVATLITDLGGSIGSSTEK